MPTSRFTVPQALSIGEAAACLGVHRETLRAAIDRGEVPAVRLGRRWLVPLSAVERLLDGQPAAARSEDPS